MALYLYIALLKWTYITYASYRSKRSVSFQNQSGGSLWEVLVGLGYGLHFMLEDKVHQSVTNRGLGFLP